MSRAGHGKLAENGKPIPKIDQDALKREGFFGERGKGVKQ